MLSMLVFYDVNGIVIGTLDHLVRYDEDGNVLELVDFEARELAGDKLRDIKDVQRLDAPIPKGIAKQILGRDPEPDEAVKLPPDHPFRLAHETVAGAGTWPEWLGGQAHQFKVELDGKRVVALIHRSTGVKRKRADIEAAIAERINDKKAEAKKRGDEMRRDLKKRGIPDAVVSQVDDPEPEPADIRDIVGGPDRPLQLDENGRTKPKVKVQRPNLPVVARTRDTSPTG